MNDSKLMNRAADNIRILAASMVEKAKSGHPGGAMGGADFVNVLFSEFLVYDPENPAWEGRDRFFLDPGHMSPMLYSQLALTGKFTIDELKVEPKNRSRVTDAFYLILSDEQEIESILKEAWEGSDMAEEWIEQQSSVEYVHFFDLEGKEADCTAAEQAITDRLVSQVPGIQCESRQQSRDSFYDLYGAMFFIGIYLGVLFLIAAVLIIYYKQISEGYDDKERFQIMQKVGMDQREVRRTIRSQVLTVFFLPLAMAVLHVAVAFQVIKKLMVTLNFTNTPLYLLCTVICIAVFAVFYAIVYAITAREYYKIVR